MEKLLIDPTKPPEKITSALLECLVMPNGEIISGGKTVGWVRSHGEYLYEHHLAKAIERAQRGSK